MRRGCAKPCYDGYSVKLPNEDGQMEDVGPLSRAAVVARLVRVKAFLYCEDAGQVSVRLERKVRGSDAGYWVAYMRRAGKLRKCYICEAYALDPYNLGDAAQRLLTGSSQDHMPGGKPPATHDSQGTGKREK